MPFVLVVIAVVAIVAGVALLATSGDRGFADVAPDGLEVALPDDRALTADDIAAVRFGLAFRGYRMQDVDDVLDRLADEIADRDRRIESLSAEVDMLSRTSTTPAATSTTSPFRPVEETRLPPEAESGPFTRTEAPSPAADAAAAVVAATPDPFRAQVDESVIAPAATPSEPGPPAPVAPEPDPAPIGGEPLAPSAAVPPSFTVAGVAAAAESAAQDLAERSASGTEPAAEVGGGSESLFTPAATSAQPAAAEPTSPALDDATPAYVETVPLPETVSDDPSLDAGQPADPPPATAKPETEPVDADVVPDLAQPSPEQPAEHRESGPPGP